MEVISVVDVSDEKFKVHSNNDDVTGNCYN